MKKLWRNGNHSVYYGATDLLEKFQGHAFSGAEDPLPTSNIAMKPDSFGASRVVRVILGLGCLRILI